MGFSDRLWIHLVEEHDAHLTVGPAPVSRRASGLRVLVAALCRIVRHERSVDACG